MNDKIPEWLEPFERKFVSADFRITDADSIKPWVDKLLGRAIASAQDIIKWLEDYSELEGIIEEDSNIRYVEMTCNTKDKEKEERYLYFVQEIQPKLIEWGDALNRKYYESPYRNKLDPAEYGRLDRILITAIELYTEKNIPLEVKLAEMSQKYQAITGAWMVEFDGRIQTMPQMSTYLQKTDRPLREQAWRAMAERRLQDSKSLDSLFDEMLKTRHEYAKNLGLSDYREYAFKSKLRDYTADDCLRFHDSIERAAVPLVERLAEKRRAEMKVESLRPWDMVVDPLGKPPLQPFKNAGELQDGVEKIFSRIDSRLGERFNSIRKMMDLESRDGKAPGGYQTTFEERRIPFIFTNAAGMHEDVTTLLHEGGHAFHTLSCRRQPMIWYRHSSMEFSEVASMTQELFGNPYLDVFYINEEDADRAIIKQLERVAEIFPWVATVDSFQHWIYTHPDHTAEDRAEQWLKISGRFDVRIDWSGINPDIRKYVWHRQLHIFEVPFYYIEYAIAQLGALMLYRIYKNDPKQAVGQYLSALALGGSRPPQELFKSAGIKMDFSYTNLSSLMEIIEKELEEYT
ncbi:MAG: M3 family oligoendopeptidase [Nitrospinae bacterium]|nr:M3 family oligoendopeptidase [Nitrospinota bacterium]